MSTSPQLRQFTPTSLESFLRCPRKYYFEKVLSLQSTRSKIGADFGSAFHKAVSTFYSLRAKGELSFEDIVIQSIHSFSADWDGKEEDGKRNSVQALSLITAYCNCYRNDRSMYREDMIETEQTIEMPLSTTLTCRIDRVLLEDNCVTVVDTKTSGSPLTEWFWKGFLNSFQMRAYRYVVEQILGNCDNVQIDAVKVPLELPEKTFQRRSMDYTELQQAEFLNTYQQVVDRILTNLEYCEEDQLGKFYQCPTACSDYGGCEFLSICQHGLSHPDVKVVFGR